MYICRLLIHLVEKHGIRKWSQIAQMLKGRIGKQCRERWHNHLRPDIKVLDQYSSLFHVSFYTVLLNFSGYPLIQTLA